MNTPQVIYENEQYALIDKPVGLTVNKSDTTKGQVTLQDWLEKRYPQFQDQTRKETHDFYKRAGFVHRLDKDTSGVILIAKTLEAFENLQMQFKNREVEKTYRAIVWGRLTQNGEIDAPITRNPFNRMRFGVFVGGKEAKTGYRIAGNITRDGEEMTLVEAFPHTGRTHQIRVHLSYIGHPIVGDPLYSGRKKGRKGEEMFGRLLLHAYRIKFTDPKTNQPVEFTSEMPEEFKSLM